MIAITGNTYPVKDQIKAMGGRWNADQKAWMVPEDKADEAKALVAGGAKPAKSTATYPDRKNRMSQAKAMAVKGSVVIERRSRDKWDQYDLDDIVSYNGSKQGRVIWQGKGKSQDNFENWVCRAVVVPV